MNTTSPSPDINPDHQIIREFIEAQLGIAIPLEKTYLIEQKLVPLQKTFDCSSFAELVQETSHHTTHDVTKAIIEAITVHESLWFRDLYPFDFLQNEIFPAFQKRLSNGDSRKLRILSAGSAKGQEAYSIGMVAEASLEQQYHNSIEIIGIDVCDTILEEARLGRYDKFEINRGLSPENQQRFFTEEQRAWLLNDPLRSRVKFQRHNLLHPLDSIGTVDIVFIRNVMIYFAEWAREKTIQNLTSILKPNGWLVLGSMESLPIKQEEFDKRREFGISIYQKK